MLNFILISAFSGLLLILAIQQLYVFHKQYNCYCASSLRYYCNYSTGKVFKTCKDCGKRILVGQFMFDKASISEYLFECKTGNDFDVDCAYKCIEDKVKIYNKYARFFEYCAYSLKTDVNN